MSANSMNERDGNVEADAIEEWEWKREDDVIWLCQRYRTLGRIEGVIGSGIVMAALTLSAWLIVWWVRS